MEVIPINFLLRSAREQRNIIYSFVSYLKISPVKLQFKVLTRRADIGSHLKTVQQEMEQETNEQCRLMQEDYLQFVKQISSRELLPAGSFLYLNMNHGTIPSVPRKKRRRSFLLQSAVPHCLKLLRQCGNEVLIPENEDEFTADVLYNLLCRNESAVKPLLPKSKR